MTGVDGEARVVGVERRAVVGIVRRRGVVPDVGLEASEERLRLGELAVVVLIGAGRVEGARTTCSSRASWPQDARRRLFGKATVRVVLATRWTHGAVERPGDLFPQGGRRVQEVQVHVAMHGDRAENLQPGGR